MKRKKFLVGLATFLLAAIPIVTQNIHCQWVLLGEPKLPEKLKRQ